MKDFMDEIVERVKNFEFSDTFDNSDEELETTENDVPIVDDNAVINEYTINN